MENPENINKILSINELKAIANDMYLEELKVAREKEDEDKVFQPVNPVGHLEKMLKSHRFENWNAPASDFLKAMMKEEFFEPHNMPSEWRTRSYSSAMSSMSKLLEHPDVSLKITNEIGKSEFDTLKQIIDGKKKSFMNEYKKVQRSAKKTEEAEKRSDTFFNSDSEPDNEGTNDNETDGDHTKVSDDRKAESIVDVEPESVVASEAVVSKAATECIPHDIFVKAQQRVRRAVSLLDKYIEHEDDEFKKLYLELIQEELQRVEETLENKI